MAVQIPDAFRQTRGATWNTRAGAGAILRIYAGAQGTDPNAAPAGVVLAQLTCSATFASVSSGGVVTANAITQDASADASGTAGSFALLQSDGATLVCKGSVTVTGGGGDLQLVTTAITAGQPVQVTSLVITEGGA